MATGSARRAAAAVAVLLSALSALSAASAAHAAEPPHQPPAEAPARGGASAPSGPKAGPRQGHGGDPSARRSIAGGPTADDVLAGPESADLRTLREAELELFPTPAAVRAGRWPSDVEPPPPGDGPRLVATGLPPATAPLAASEPRGDMPGLDHLEMPDLPVRWDERVLRYLRFFRDDPYGRTTFSNLYRHSGRWREMLRRALRRRSLPDDLAWLCMIESGFDASAHSSAGAVGLWQLMPETAKIYGLTVDRWVDQRLNPALATQAATTFLDDLHRRFGSWELALAGFNMGHAGLASVVRRYNTNDFWSLAHTEGTLPWETTLYVPKILAAAIISHNLTAFGFGDVVVDTPVETDDVDVPPATPLALVAQAAGCTPREIEALNPELKATRTPPTEVGEAPYVVRVPQGKGATVGQALTRLRKDQPALERYTVRFGETLDQVAAARRTTPQKLVELNAIAPGEVIRGGTVLLVPGLGAGETAPTVPAGPKTSVVVPSDVFVYPNRERVFYRVLALDTLKDIAAAIHVSQDDLRRWNDLDAGARLQEGMTLQAFVPEAVDLSGVFVLHEKDVRVLAVGSEEFFAVLEQDKGFKRTTVSAKAGETVESIGKHFSVPARTMERINRRPRNDALKPGEAVVVYVPCKVPGAPRVATATSEPATASTRASQPTD